MFTELLMSGTNTGWSASPPPLGPNNTSLLSSSNLMKSSRAAGSQAASTAIKSLQERVKALERENESLKENK